VEDLLEYLAKCLVDKPEEVSVTRREEDGAVILELRVAPDEVGKVIGKGGRVALALRTLVRASGARGGERVVLQIADR
jgi:uncharacterized protein